MPGEYDHLRKEPGDRIPASDFDDIADGLSKELHGEGVQEDRHETLLGPRVPVPGLIELMLAENHPGRGEVFKCRKGTWCADTDDWRFTCTDECDDWVFAKDFRYDVPYPNKGARGLFFPQPSHHYGVIYVCVDLDCTSPGLCTEQDVDLPCPAPEEDPYDGECA